MFWYVRHRAAEIYLLDIKWQIKLNLLIKNPTADDKYKKQHATESFQAGETNPDVDMYENYRDEWDI